MDAIVAAPYGLGQVKKDSDHAEARILEELLLPLLREALNRYHGAHYCERFWRMKKLFLKGSYFWKRINTI
jgi:hypothetical protein